MTIQHIPFRSYNPKYEILQMYALLRSTVCASLELSFLQPTQAKDLDIVSDLTVEASENVVEGNEQVREVGCSCCFGNSGSSLVKKCSNC